MGATASRPQVEVEDGFRASVLLVHAPDSLHGCSLAGGAWAVLRNFRVDVVRWDGRPLAAEQYRRTVAAHHGVVYFFDPCDVTQDEIAARLRAVLHPIAAATADSAVPIHLCTYALRTRRDEHFSEYGESPGMPSLLSLTKNVLAVASSESGRATKAATDAIAKRLTYQHISTEGDLTRVLSALSWTATPRKLARPLGNLLRDFANASGASAALLVDATAFLPLMGHFAAPDPGPRSELERAVELVRPFREVLRVYTADAGAKLKAIRVAADGADVFCAWAAPPYCFQIVVVPQTAASVGTALIDVNMQHYALHYANVISHTTERASFTPIAPP